LLPIIIYGYAAKERPIKYEQMWEKMISIIVGIRNEEKYIGDCILSLLNLDYPKESYEIIVVDGMSNDNTQNIIKQYPVKLILNLNSAIL
jgi:glycosyltransferase involved in cell wall biosynthesis